VAGNTTKKQWWPENSLFNGPSLVALGILKMIWWPTRSSLVAPGFFSGRLYQVPNRPNNTAVPVVEGGINGAHGGAVCHHKALPRLKWRECRGGIPHTKSVEETLLIRCLDESRCAVKAVTNELTAQIQHVIEK
jgi:hypothetical protein